MEPHKATVPLETSRNETDGLTPWASLKVCMKVRPEVFKPPTAVRTTFPPDSVTLINAAVSARPELDEMPGNAAKVTRKTLAEHRVFGWIFKSR